MKAVVLYKSKYGSTKQYAKWIADSLNADIFESDAIAPEAIANYDTIIFGGPVYGGAIMGIATIANNMNILKDKRVFIFTVGITPTDATTVFENLLEKNYTPLMMKRAHTFHLLGNLEIKNLSLGHKILLKMITSSMRDKPDMHQNNLSRDAIKPLVDAVLNCDAETNLDGQSNE